MTSIKNKAVNSTKWTTIQTIVVGIVGPVSLFVKSQFLSPSEFAYIALLLIIVGFFKLFENFGISQAIIQRDTVTIEELSSLLFFNLFLSFLLFLTVFLLSSPLESFYSLPGLNSYIKLISFIILVNGPSLLFRAFLEKELYFKELAIISIIRNLILFTSMTIFFLFGLKVISVVLANLISSALASFAIIIIAIRAIKIDIRLFFSFKKIASFVRFGVFVSGKQLVTFLTNYADELIIGHLLAPEILGIYHFGKEMLLKIKRLITRTFGKVLFPIFSKIKKDKSKLTRSYLQVSKYLAMVAFPLFMIIAISSHLFIPIIFGEKWQNSVIVFEIFSISMIFSLITSNVSSALLYAIKKPETVFYIDIITSSLYLALLLLFAKHGMIYILSVYSLYIILKTTSLQYYANKPLHHKFKNFFENLSKPAVASFIMSVVIILLMITFKNLLGGFIIMVGSIVIGILLYVFILYTSCKNDLRELRELVLIMKREK